MLRHNTLFLEKIEALEEKIKTEMVTLKEKMGKMNEDMKIFSDIDRLGHRKYVYSIWQIILPLILKNLLYIIHICIDNFLSQFIKSLNFCVVKNVDQNYNEYNLIPCSPKQIVIKKRCKERKTNVEVGSNFKKKQRFKGNHE